MLVFLHLFWDALEGCKEPIINLLGAGLLAGRTWTHFGVTRGRGRRNMKLLHPTYREHTLHVYGMEARAGKGVAR